MLVAVAAVEVAATGAAAQTIGCELAHWYGHERAIQMVSLHIRALVWCWRASRPVREMSTLRSAPASDTNEPGVAMIFFNEYPPHPAPLLAAISIGVCVGLLCFVCCASIEPINGFTRHISANIIESGIAFQQLIQNQPDKKNLP